MNLLKDKHPDLHPDCAFPPAPSEGDCSNSITVSVDDITRSLKSFKNGSSGGPDGLTPQHLKDLTSEALGETSRNLLQALVMFTNGIVLCGNIPSPVCSSFFGATLFSPFQTGWRSTANCNWKHIQAFICKGLHT